MPEVAKSRRWEGVDPAVSNAMSKVKAKDTKPEMIVRRLVYALGHRYRLHRKDLPGSPDLVFFGRRKIVFVHGCFWHGHVDLNCNRARMPKTRVEFWTTKIERNRVRDDASINALIAAGWQVLVVWECETGIRNRTSLQDRLQQFLVR